ncbi:MAG: SCO family protein [Verrucomicrobia bacterium]|nr:SCO family protein [Verrucomicrobiota bacterium]
MNRCGDRWRRAAIVGFGWALLAAMLPGRSPGASPDVLTRGIGYEQKLGNRVPSGLTFVDEQGRTVNLGRYFGNRPVVLAMGYYRCPLLCGVGLNATARTIEEFPPSSPSRNFEFIFVSVDPTEQPLAAAQKKGEYLRKLDWDPAAGRSHFLTGGETSVAQLADEIGFRYRYDPGTKQYIHPSGLVVLSPEGTITSYLSGITYSVPDFERALAKARRGEPGIVGEIVSILCYSHDPVDGSVGYYVLLGLRGGAILTLGGLVLLVRRKRRVTGRYSGA